MTATSTGYTLTSGGGAFNNLTFKRTGGGWTLMDSILNINGNFTITQGRLRRRAILSCWGQLEFENGRIYLWTSTVNLTGTGNLDTRTSIIYLPPLMAQRQL